MSTRFSLLAVVVVIGTIGIVGVLPGAALAADAPSDATSESVAPLSGSQDATHEHNESGANDSTESFSMGAQVSSFMQSSAAETDETIDRTMWEQRVERSETQEEQVETVEHRMDTMNTRIGEIETTQQSLVEARENETITETEYQARMSWLLGQLMAMETSADRTAEVAEQTGLDEERIEELRANPSDAAGSELVDIAEATPVNSPGPKDGTHEDGHDRIGGGDGVPGIGTPPSDAGPPGDGDAGDADPPSNAGPPSDGDDGDAGPPSNAGPPSDGDDGDAGPPSDAGPPGDGDAGDADPPSNAGPPSDGD